MRLERQLNEPHFSLPLPVPHLQEPRLHFEPSLESHLQILDPALSGALPPLELSPQPIQQHLRVSSFDVAQSALGEFGQLRVTHRVHRGGPRLSCQRLHLGDRMHDQGCLGPEVRMGKGEPTISAPSRQ